MTSRFDVNFGRQPINPRALVVYCAAGRYSVIAYRDDGPDLCGIRERAPDAAVQAWVADATAWGLTIETIDVTPAGPQRVLPGDEKAGLRMIAQRKADAPIRPKSPQKPCDIGLFGDDKNQLDLLSGG